VTIAQTFASHGARRQLWRVLLALSLALNLFFVAGALWIRIHAPPPSISPEQRLEQMAGELGLDPQQRTAFAQYSQTMREHLQAMHEAIRPLIGETWSELAKPQADESRVMQLLDQGTQTRRHFLRGLTTTTLAFLATLTPEQRTKFVALVHWGPRPWSPPRAHDHRDGAR
jgi:uncharacterized membrane protein